MQVLYRSITIIFLFSVFLSTPVSGANALSEQTINIVTIINKFHYTGIQLNEKTTLEIKREFLETLDPLRCFFVRDDVNFLLSVKLDLIALKENDVVPFVEKTIQIYRQRLKGSEIILEDTLKKGLNYQINETIIFDDKLLFPENKNQLVKRWEMLLKYKILSKFFYKNFNEKLPSNYLEMFTAQEPAIREIIGRREKAAIKRIFNYSDGIENYVTAAFLNSIALICDPHTMYLPKKDKINFESVISSKGLSYGLYFKNDIRGEVRIERLVPGGPAWKSGKLNKDDIITEISFPLEENTAYDVQDISPAELYNLLNNPKSENIIITVIKTNGRVEKASLVREKIQTERNIINSFILSGEKKIGYIYLPAFYADWDDPGVPACANDVAIEIIKLKKENVEGIILDLRNNSGGSLLEAMLLAGLFIDEGPLYIQARKGAKPILLKDPNRGTVYDGPLAVIVNRQSASASELFVSAMRDYNRAVIVGSPTFGKASGQVILPLTREIANKSNLDQIDLNLTKDSNSDFIKITASCFFDLSGNTHQLTGISPDIMLPDVFEDMFVTENKMRNSLLPEKVQKDVKYNKLPGIPAAKISGLSNGRLSRDKNFQGIKALNTDMKKYASPGRTINLNIDVFMKEKTRVTGMINSLTKLLYCASSLRAENNVNDSEVIKMDKYKNELNKEFIKQISEDIYINESYSIINDYIRLIEK
jgi:carboxyl-terminal processing protease